MLRAGRRQQALAFTLVEVLLVLAIFAILAAVTTRRILAPAAYAELKGSSRLLAADLLWLRDQAITQRKKYRLVIGETRYTLEQQTADERSYTVVETRYLPARVKIASHTIGSGGTLTLLATGEPESGTAEIVLAAAGRWTTVEILASGLARWTWRAAP